ncbi:MAG TPA: pantetheine-phosphate adenylyltransferase [Chthoniobacterales bacterium]
MRKAIYPGSFDPATYGHLDVLKRATHLFDEVVIAVAASESKKPLFSVDERVHLIEESIDHLNQVRVIRFDGLLVNLVREVSAVAVIRGLRAVSDFEFEFQMALMNRKLEPSLETIFLTPKEDYTYLSSRIVKEIARLGGDVTSFVPPAVEKALRVKFASASNAKNPFPV